MAMDFSAGHFGTPIRQFSRVHGAADSAENAKARRHYIRECEEHFADFPRFNFVRALGSGGFGMALKFEQRDEKDQHLRFLVLKIPTMEGPALVTFETEFRWYLRLSGAEHLVSLAEPSEPSAGGTQWPGGPHPPGNEGFMQSPPLHYLFLEYLPHGDLLDLCIKLNQNDEHNHYHNTRYTTMIPRRLLWRIFLCLARACVGLAFPPRSAADVDRLLDEKKIAALPRWREEVPEVPRQPARIVHLDMDTSNILVGDPDPSDHEHGLHPVTKLGDYGLMREMSQESSEIDVFRARVSGKKGYRAPEQEEDLNALPLAWDNTGHKTNVWGIGVTMLALMTRAHPDETLFTGTERCQIHQRSIETYGWFVGRAPRDIPWGSAAPALYARYNQALRHMVARCMAADPADRPAPGPLLDAVRRSVAAGDAAEAAGRSPPGESDADLAAFCRAFFYSPVGPPYGDPEEAGGRFVFPRLPGGQTPPPQAGPGYPAGPQPLAEQFVFPRPMSGLSHQSRAGFDHSPAHRSMSGLSHQSRAGGDHSPVDEPMGGLSPGCRGNDQDQVMGGT